MMSERTTPRVLKKLVEKRRQTMEKREEAANASKKPERVKEPKRRTK
jgi:hypothetical protein